MKQTQQKTVSTVKGRSHGRKRREFKILDRRCRVAELYLQGNTQSSIAAMLDITTSTIANDLEQCRREWKERAAWAFDQRKEEELAKIDNLERINLEAWEASKLPQKVTRYRKEKVRINIPQRQGGGSKLVDGGIVEETIVKDGAGDPRFLEQAMACIELRLKIFNITKGNTTNINNTINWSDMLGPPLSELNPIEAKITASNPLGLPSTAITIIENEELTQEPSTIHDGYVVGVEDE